MESFQLELHPERGPIHIALFKDIKNATELRQRLVAQDTSLRWALVNATLVISTFQILLAINKAVHKEATGKLKTHKVNSEIVYDFSSSNNISQSLRRYGVSDDSTALIAVAIGGNPSEVEKGMQADIHGELVPLSSIPEFSDIKLVRKYYQLNDKDLSDNIDELMPLIAGAMALKEIK
ncbi:kinase binding protein CGI-121-domain-containing protein [Umbelopsis sp. PMI_123]|nr:kinase binding protein CGI-121-domain-containing protein [Umbelopsis sp. PMI_123]